MSVEVVRLAGAGLELVGVCLACVACAAFAWQRVQELIRAEVFEVVGSELEHRGYPSRGYQLRVSEETRRAG